MGAVDSTKRPIYNAIQPMNAAGDVRPCGVRTALDADGVLRRDVLWQQHDVAGRYGHTVAIGDTGEFIEFIQPKGQRVHVVEVAAVQIRCRRELLHRPCTCPLEDAVCVAVHDMLGTVCKECQLGVIGVSADLHVVFEYTNFDVLESIIDRLKEELMQGKEYFESDVVYDKGLL